MSTYMSGFITPSRATAAGTMLASNLDAVAEIKKLFITTGSYTGGYQKAPNGMLHWYFANLGLTAITPYLSATDLDIYIRSYLDLYLGKLESNYSIMDVEFTDGLPEQGVLKLRAPDSHDSYASTFLSLVAAYIIASKNFKWFNINKQKLKMIAEANLAKSRKPNGLISNFQSTNGIGHLMDQCEAYRGLRDFAALLRNSGDVSADRYDSVVNSVVNGIRKHLFDTAAGGFISSDDLSSVNRDFYPGLASQVFPQAFGLVELSSYFNKAWRFLNTTAPNWQDGHYSNYPNNDKFPDAYLGFVAAQRGSITQAETQILSVNELFANVDNRQYVTINELGFYHKTQAVLGNIYS